MYSINIYSISDMIYRFKEMIIVLLTTGRNCIMEHYDSSGSFFILLLVVCGSNRMFR